VAVDYSILTHPSWVFQPAVAVLHRTFL